MITLKRNENFKEVIPTEENVQARDSAVSDASEFSDSSDGRSAP